VLSEPGFSEPDLSDHDLGRCMSFLVNKLIEDRESDAGHEEGVAEQPHFKDEAVWKGSRYLRAAA
jgi:hypothetical protein